MIVPFYAALLALILLALSFRTLRLRHKLRIGIGHGNDPQMERAMRVHANFCEYVPISLLLLFFLETLTGSGWWIHALCLALLAGRAIHAFGVSQVEENYQLRVAGMALTFTAFLSAALGIFLTYLPLGGVA